MAKIQIKRGLQAAVNDLDLDIGELALATDSGNVYIGTTDGTKHVNPTGGVADTADKLSNPRSFSISGDATATAVSFDGSANVNLALVLDTISGLAAGTYGKVTVDTKGRVTAGTQLVVADLPSIPASKVTGLPTKVSDLTNDSAFQTASQVQTAVSALVASAPEALNTLNELAAALGDDANFSTTVNAAIGNRELLLSGAAAKTSIVDADKIVIVDGTTTKKVGFTAVKTALKSYFDTLYNKYVHPTHTAKSSGLYKLTVDGLGHVTGAVAVVKADITRLGIPASDTVYSLPTASSTVMGGVKIGTGLTISSGKIAVGHIDGGTF